MIIKESLVAGVLVDQFLSDSAHYIRVVSPIVMGKWMHAGDIWVDDEDFVLY